MRHAQEDAECGSRTATAAVTAAFRAEVLRNALRERAEQEILQRLGATVKAALSAGVDR